MKTADLTGAALDWAVAKCEGLLHDDGTVSDYWQPSELWEQGGPIIEREGICIGRVSANYWIASPNAASCKDNSGISPLIAAMVCYVASKLGDTVEVPEELLK